MDKTICAICASELGAETKLISCPECGHEACSKCIKLFLLTVQDGAFKCMFPDCGSIWSYPFVSSQLSRHWIETKHKSYLKSVLITEQRRYLKDTGYFVQLTKDYTAAEKNLYNLLAAKKAIEEQLSNLRQEITTTKTFITSINKELEDPNAVFYNSMSYKRLCLGAKCHGVMFQIDDTLQCNICEIQACRLCHEILVCDSRHVCNEQQRSSVEFIKANSKQCPNCLTSIEKSYGCAQIWCTHCHTFFDYETGKADTTGFRHNPHFHEYLQNNSEARDANNAGLLEQYEAAHGYTGIQRQYMNQVSQPGVDDRGIPILEQPFFSNDELKTISPYIQSAYSSLLYYHSVEIPKTCHEIEVLNNVELMGRKSRIRYLKGEITEEQLGTKLYILHKRLEKLTAFRNIYTTYVVKGTTIIRKALNTNSSSIEFEFASFYSRLNNRLSKICHRLNCVHTQLII